MNGETNTIYLPDIDCPHCETATIYTHEGVNDDGEPLGAIYCATCQRVYQQAFDVRVLPEWDAEAEDNRYECEYCGGSGVGADGLPCEACEGTGWDW